MADEDKDQKTEEASSKRQRQSEERGQFAQSRELTSTLVLFGAILAFSFSSQRATRDMMITWQTLFGQTHVTRMTSDEMQGLLIWVCGKMGIVMAPVLLSILIAGVAANLIQTGGLKFSLHPLQPNWGKLDPMKGLGRIISQNGLMELFKSLFKIAVVSMVVYITIKARLDEIPTLMEYSIVQTWNFMGEVSLKLMIRVLLTMILLAGIDYGFQKFSFSKGQRMTKQEVKDERKESEGDPLIKQRIRSAQMQMARKRMMAAVPKADVVVTNPTHISVAIKYDSSQHAVPIVVAKGMGHMAAKIREIAKANGIPLVEDKPLARTLYKTVEVGQFIPAALYKAVAEILAYVYRLKGRFTV